MELNLNFLFYFINSFIFVETQQQKNCNFKEWRHFNSYRPLLWRHPLPACTLEVQKLLMAGISTNYANAGELHTVTVNCRVWINTRRRLSVHLGEKYRAQSPELDDWCGSQVSSCGCCPLTSHTDFIRAKAGSGALCVRESRWAASLAMLARPSPCFRAATLLPTE